MAAADFLSRYLSGPLPYVRSHITVNKMCLSASLNKIPPSSVPLNHTLRVMISSLYGVKHSQELQASPHGQLIGAVPKQSAQGTQWAILNDHMFSINIRLRERS